MYILQEIQTTSSSTSLLPAVTYTDKAQAESAFFTAMAAAAISPVDVHTVMIYDEYGNTVRREFYDRRLRDNA